MDTGLEYEGEAARKRFIVYWLRPAIAALGFGAFTFLVISIPSEKEKIQLRGQVQQLRSENEQLHSRLRVRTRVAIGAPGSMPRSEVGKARRVFEQVDDRDPLAS